MQLKIPILSALVILTTVLAIPLATRPAAANTGFGVDDPGNVWVPYGPYGAATPGSYNPVNKLLMHFYSSENVEFTNFELGQVDVLDWEAPQSKFSPWDSNADFLLTPTQGQFGDFGLYFNGASSTWGNWGCEWTNGGTPGTTSIRVYNNTRQLDALGVACDVNMREAFAHLMDRPRWTVDGILQGTAQALADDSPPAKAPAGSSLTEQCSWDKLFPSCISAFNIAPDAGGFAATGSQDFCAAADHMVHAGVATGKTAGSCILTGVNSGVFSHPLRFMIRSDKPPRLQFGNGELDAINRLFGGVASVATYGNIRQIGFPIVFSEPPEGPIDDWDAYTYGYGLGSPFADHLFPFYYSLFATDYCGGIQESEPNNVQFVCNTTVDSDTLAAATTDDIPTYVAATLRVFHDLGSIASTIPVYADGVRLGALRSVSGLVNQRGLGYTNVATMSYAHKDPLFTPSNSLYAFGGGDSSTLRWGQASGTLELNPFNAQTVWEFNVLASVYDSLFSGSPVQLDHTICNMCQKVRVNPTDIPNFPAVAGDQLYDVTLRHDLRWHDGQPVTAHDVAWTALNLARYAANLGSGLLLLRGVKEVASDELLIEWQGKSISYPIDMEFLVFPSHLWEDTSATPPASCADQCTWGAGPLQLQAPNIHPASTAKQDASYDPIAAGTFVGSGTWACVSVFPQDIGKVGTGCAQSASGQRIGQAIGVDGRLQLSAFDFISQAGNTDPFLQYYRTYNPAWPGSSTGISRHSGQFQEWNYAQQGNTGTVTGNDLTSAAACFGANAANNYNGAACGLANYNYWARSAFETTPGTISGEVDVVNSHVDDTFISPYWPWTTTQLENIATFTHP